MDAILTALLKLGHKKKEKKNRKNTQLLQAKWDSCGNVRALQFMMSVCAFVKEIKCLHMPEYDNNKIWSDQS